MLEDIYTDRINMSGCRWSKEHTIMQRLVIGGLED